MSLTKVILPKLGLTMDEGKIVAWRKREGERVDAGEILFEVETDKATMEVESPATGIVRRVLIGEGETAPVASVIAVIAQSADEPIEHAVVVEAPSVGARPAGVAPTSSSSLSSSPPVDPDRVRFWEVFGNLRWGIICISQAQSGLASGALPAGAQMELASIGRRTAETEWELLNLMEQA